MRYALLLGYDGSGFSGFQRQNKGERTVQGVLEAAAEQVFHVPTRVFASGRTDAGVHALGQVCHLDGESSIPPEKLFSCLNVFLPPDVRVYKSIGAPEGFDCTRGAKRKTYVYRIYTAPASIPLLERYAVLERGVPCLDRMRYGADMVVGEHDFKAFCASGSSAKTTVRTVYGVEIKVRTENLYTMYEISVTGNGFLYNMVRILAGEIFAVGMGKDPSFLARALGTGERGLLAKTMPAKGLTLLAVDYGVPLFGTDREV